MDPAKLLEYLVLEIPHVRKDKVVSVSISCHMPEYDYAIQIRSLFACPPYIPHRFPLREPSPINWRHHPLRPQTICQTR